MILLSLKYVFKQLPNVNHVVKQAWVGVFFGPDEYKEAACNKLSTAHASHINLERITSVFKLQN